MLSKCYVVRWIRCPRSREKLSRFHSLTGWFTLHSTERPAYRAHKGVQILFSARTVQHPGELSEKRRGRLPLRPNDFHACSFMRRKSILEEDAFFFLLLLLVVLRVCMMKREQKQQIIFPTCGFAAKASGKLFHPCLAALADHILQPCRRSETEAAGGTTSPLLLIGTRGSVLAAGREQAGAGWDSFQADRKVEGSEEHSPASGSFHACFLTGSQREPHEVGTLVPFYRRIQSPSLPATRD